MLVASDDGIGQIEDFRSASVIGLYLVNLCLLIAFWEFKDVRKVGPSP